MSEEKKEEKAEKQESQPEEKKEAKVEEKAAKQEEKKEAPAEAAPPAEEASAEAAPEIKETHTKHPKVTKMTMEQVEKAMEETTKRMGGLHSRYGRSLLERKAMLKKMPHMGAVKKAA